LSLLKWSTAFDFHFKDQNPKMCWATGVALHDQGVALATQKIHYFLIGWYIWLPKIKNFELPQTNLVVKN